MEMAVSAAGPMDLQTMCDEVATRMEQAAATAMDKILGPMACKHREWHGDNMQVKGPHTGARLATLNVAKKLYSHEEYKLEIIQLMEETQVDMMLITEPGGADPMAQAALKNFMIARDMAAE